MIDENGEMSASYSNDEHFCGLHDGLSTNLPRPRFQRHFDGYDVDDDAVSCDDRLGHHDFGEHPGC